MFNGSSKYTQAAREKAQQAAHESAEQLAQFTARTAVGITLSQEQQASMEQAAREKALMDIAQGINETTSNLIAASNLRKPSPLLFSSKPEIDRDSTPNQPKPLNQSSNSWIPGKDKPAEEIDEDAELKELAEKITNIECELQTLAHDSDTSEKAYQAWKEGQEKQLIMHAEPTAQGEFNFDSYEIWASKVQARQTALQDSLKTRLKKANQDYKVSLDEFKVAKRYYQVAFGRKFKELTNIKTYGLDSEEATAYMAANFPSEKDFYKKLYYQDATKLIDNSQHPLAAEIKQLINGEIPTNLAWQDPQVFKTHPLPSGLSALAIEHSERLFDYHLKDCGIKTDKTIKNVIGTAKFATKVAKASNGVSLALEAAGMGFENVKCDDARKEKSINEFDTSILIAHQIMQREIVSNEQLITIHARFDYLKNYSNNITNISNIPSQIRTHAKQVQMGNEKLFKNLSEKLPEGKQKTNSSYGQPKFY